MFNAIIFNNNFSAFFRKSFLPSQMPLTHIMRPIVQTFSSTLMSKVSFNIT